MNPPGVPMLYAAESPGVAIAEIRAKSAYVGVFELLRDVTVLDLVDLPNVPGVFAGDERWRRLALSFLHDFRDDIMKPVARDERTHIDYIPTQIVTEFFRHHGAGNVAFDGIRYPSAVVANGGNLVLFAVQEDVVDAVAQSTGHGAVGSQRSPKPWLRLVSARRRNRK
jgi:RES domain-containing protein